MAVRHWQSTSSQTSCVLGDPVQYSRCQSSGVEIHMHPCQGSRDETNIDLEEHKHETSRDTSPSPCTVRLWISTCSPPTPRHLRPPHPRFVACRGPVLDQCPAPKSMSFTTGWLMSWVESVHSLDLEGRRWKRGRLSGWWQMDQQNK